MGIKRSIEVYRYEAGCDGGVLDLERGGERPARLKLWAHAAVQGAVKSCSRDTGVYEELLSPCGPVSVKMNI